MKSFIFFAAVALYAFFAFEPPHMEVTKQDIAHAEEVVTVKVADPWMR